MELSGKGALLATFVRGDDPNRPSSNLLGRFAKRYRKETGRDFTDDGKWDERNRIGEIRFSLLSFFKKIVKPIHSPLLPGYTK